MTEDGSTSDENEPELTHGTEPHTALCQRCGDEFEWMRDVSGVGWEKSEWVSGGRYGLAGSS